MINLRSRKDVHILVGVPKRRIKPIPTQEETQVEEELEPPTFQHTGVNIQATTSADNDNPAPVGEDVATSTTSIQTIVKEKQHVQLVTTQQFRDAPLFPQRFQKQKQDK